MQKTDVQLLLIMHIINIAYLFTYLLAQ